MSSEVSVPHTTTTTTTTTTSLSSDMSQPVGHIPPLRLIVRLDRKSRAQSEPVTVATSCLLPHQSRSRSED
ncbi:hypothetical protein INR49_008413 [Caranx melampygus]|nr:hypothetical protein INR49_008413 [Caranx melampygus]